LLSDGEAAGGPGQLGKTQALSKTKKGTESAWQTKTAFSLDGLIYMHYHLSLAAIHSPHLRRVQGMHGVEL
jgi:hypothetical protein